MIQTNLKDSLETLNPFKRDEKKGQLHTFKKGDIYFNSTWASSPVRCSLGFFIDPREEGFGKDSIMWKAGRIRSCGKGTIR